MAHEPLASKGVNAEPVTADDLRPTPQMLSGKLLGWVGLVAAVTTINYAANYLGHASKKDTEEALFRYSTAVGAFVIYGIILGIVLVIARERRDLLAWRTPKIGWLRHSGSRW